MSLGLESNHLTDQIVDDILDKIRNGRLGAVHVDRNWISSHLADQLRTEYKARYEKFEISGVDHEYCTVIPAIRKNYNPGCFAV